MASLSDMKLKSASSLPQDQQPAEKVQKLEEDDASELSNTCSSSDDKEFDEEMDTKLEMTDHLMASSDRKLKSSSTLPEDPLPPEKKQKLGEGDTSPLSKTPSSSSSSSHDKESDKVRRDERDMTDEEFKEYYSYVVDSDGFNVPQFPDVDCCGMIVPLFDYSEEFAQDLFGYSERAIAIFNDDNGTAYKVLRVDRVMAQAVRGLKYYITFQAKDGDTTKTFEATVLYGIPDYPGHDATKVFLCREQGDRRVSAVNYFGEEDESESDEEMLAQNEEGASMKV